MTRSNRLLALGAVVTLLGAALVAVVLMVQRPADPVATAPPTSTTSSSEGAAPATAEGEAQTAPVAVPTVPDGLEAVAFTVDFQGSVAGLPQVGDRVNVYGLPRAGTSRSDEDGDARLARLLEDVEVLAITGADHGTNGGNPTVVLGLEPGDVGASLSSHDSRAVHLTLVERAGGRSDAEGSQAADDAPGEGDA